MPSRLDIAIIAAATGLLAGVLLHQTRRRLTDIDEAIAELQDATFEKTETGDGDEEGEDDVPLIHDLQHPMRTWAEDDCTSVQLSPGWTPQIGFHHHRQEGTQ